MPDLTEAYEKIRTIALADGTLTGLLSSATAFYYGADLAISPTQPFIVMRPVDDQPMQQDSAWGDFRPRLQIDVVGTNPQRLSQIVARLDELFIIPFKRASYISTANFTVRSMMRVNGLLLPEGRREEDGMGFQQMVTEWILKITAKS